MGGVVDLCLKSQRKFGRSQPQGPSERLKAAEPGLALFGDVLWHF